MAIFTRFSVIGVSADLAEYSVPNIRRFLAEYSAEYSVFGRTLLLTTKNFVKLTESNWKIDSKFTKIQHFSMKSTFLQNKLLLTLQSRIRVAPRLFILEEKYDHYNLIKSTMIIYFLQNWIFSPITWIFPLFS